MRRTPFIGQINGVFLCHVEQSILMNYAKRYCVEEQRSLSSLSNEYAVDASIIRKWRDMYLCNGDKGIKPINNKYSGKFKEDMLSYYYSHNMLLRATAVYTSNINVSISEINYLFSQLILKRKRQYFEYCLKY